MCLGDKREIICIVLHVLLSLSGFNVIYGQEIATYTFAPTTTPTTNRPTTLLATPHRLTPSTSSSSSSIAHFQNRLTTTNLPKKHKIVNSTANLVRDIKRLQESHIPTPSHHATQHNRNIVSNTNSIRLSNQQTSIHAHNHDPSQKETFLGQVTLNSPAELPPQFNREELEANFRIRNDNTSDHNKSSKYRRMKTNTGVTEFSSNKSSVTTERPIFAPLYFAFKPTRYTIMPKSKLLDLEPLLEEPMNKKEYYKHNKQDVQVIISMATTDLTDALHLSGVTTEISKTSEYTAKAEITTETTKTSDDIKMTITSSTIRTTVKLPTTTKFSHDMNLEETPTSITSKELTSGNAVNTIKAKSTTLAEKGKHKIDKQRDELGKDVITQKTANYSTAIDNSPTFRSIQKTLNTTPTSSELETDKLRQPLAINIQLRETTKNRLSLPSDLLGKASDQREFKKQQALSGTLKIFLKATSRIETTAKPSSKLNTTFWKGSFTTSMLNEPMKDSLPSNNLNENEDDDKLNISKRKLAKNRPLSLIKSWSTRFNHEMEPSTDVMPVPLTTLPPKRTFFETSPKFSQSIMATRISELASFNVCSEKCELAGIIKLIDGVTWMAALSDRNTREWRNLAGEIQLQLQKTYSQSGVLRKWYRNIRIDGFSEGSVLVDYIVEFDNTGKQINTLEIRRLFHESLNQREKPLGNAMRLGNFTIDPLYTDFIVLPPVSSAVIEYVENNLLPQWAIAVIVIGLASFLFVIIFAITILTNRRKTSKRKTTPPFNEDIFDEMNKKVLGIDNYGVDNIYNME